VSDPQATIDVAAKTAGKLPMIVRPHGSSGQLTAINGPGKSIAAAIDEGSRS
jgi:hypothetical protein